jgi:prophage antirepressor-like protein
MTTLQLFNYGTQEVRTDLIDGEPWFVASDVAKILGYRDAANLTRRLDPEDKGTQSVSTPSGDQHMTVISEPGLYVAVLGSQVDGAKAFKRWITHEVLPAIRKTGTYSTAPVLTGPELMARALMEAAETIRVAEAEVKALTPKAEAFDVFLSTDGDYSINEAAKILSRDDNILTGENRLREKLLEWRWMYRDGRNKPRAMQSQVECGRLVEKAQFHFHPATGEKILDAPQVRITAKGFTAVRTRLLNESKGLTA